MAALQSSPHRDDEVMVFAIVGCTVALANESLATPLNVEMIEQEPGSR